MQKGDPAWRLINSDDGANARMLWKVMVWYQHLNIPTIITNFLHLNNEARSLTTIIN